MIEVMRVQTRRKHSRAAAAPTADLPGVVEISRTLSKERRGGHDRRDGVSVVSLGVGLVTADCAYRSPQHSHTFLPSRST